MQLYLSRPGTEGLEQLTDYAEPVFGWWVPGSERLLIAIDEGGNERAQLYLLDARPGAEPEPLVVEPNFLHVGPRLSRDGGALAYACNRRNNRDLDVFVRSLSTGAERRVFAPGGYCEPAGFSPDGRWLGVIRLTDRTGDFDLHLVDLEGDGSFLVEPDEDDAFFGEPAWLPDSSGFFFATSSGRDVAAVARYDLATRTWCYVLESDWELAPTIDAAGTVLVVTANEEGASTVRLHDPETLQLRRELELPARGVVDPLVVSPGGACLAFAFSSPTLPWEAWLADTATGDLRRLTAGGDAVARDELVEPSLHRFASFDGESVPVFVFEPPGADSNSPVLIEIHGGPEAQRRPMWIPLVQYFALSGFVVAQPNVRGSTGYGKRYEHLDDIRLRLDSVRDVVALHDWLASQGRFATDRTVLYGGSYGGYMVLAGLAFHSERWAAAIAVVPVSSFVTFLQNTSVWRRSFREREYGSLEHDREFLEEVSPLTHVDRIVAPLFLIHGENDPRVPVGEAHQIHEALTSKGIPCELLVYPDEGHGLNKLKNRLDAYPKAVAFVESVLDRSFGTEPEPSSRS
jgi:dipeptidyl aminopeptidase/acylaminoacyl peptidase